MIIHTLLQRHFDFWWFCDLVGYQTQKRYRMCLHLFGRIDKTVTISDRWLFISWTWLLRYPIWIITITTISSHLTSPVGSRLQAWERRCTYLSSLTGRFTPSLQKPATIKTKPGRSRDLACMESFRGHSTEFPRHLLSPPDWPPSRLPSSWSLHL